MKGRLPIMDNVIPGLYASTPEPLGFGPSLEIRAFLLQREGGNLLIYRSASLEQDAEEVNGLGGISRQYLNHHHEASPACDWVAETFGAPLHVHEDDAGAASEICEVGETFSERHMLGDDFEVVPIPGHTAGATAFLWDGGSIVFCLPETRCSSAGAGGGPRCSTGSATGNGTSRAWG